MGKFLAEVAGGESVEQVCDLGRAKPRRRRGENVDVVPVRLHFKDREPVPITARVDQPLRLRLDLPGENFSPVLGNPGEVIGNIVMGPSRLTAL